MRLVSWILALLVLGGSSPAGAQNPFGSSATALRGWRLCNPIGTKTDGYVLTWDGTNTCWKSAVSGAGASNALTLSGSIVGTGSLNMPISGLSCGKVVLASSQLTGALLVQEIPFLVVPANWRITEVRINPVTPFTWASTGTTLTMSVQQQGNTTSPDIIPAINIMTGAVFLDDIPANPNLSSHTISLYVVGNAAFSNLNSGKSVEVTYCGHVVL